MQSKVKIGIVGCGGIANALYLPGIRDIPRAEVVALCDVVPERAQMLGQRFNIPQAYTDLDEMLAKAGLDLLIDTTTIQSHYGVNLKAVEVGVNVYTEKSMTVTVEESNHLIEAAKAKGVLLASAPDMMVRPRIQRIQELVDSQFVGPVVWARSRSSHGGPESFAVQNSPAWFYQPGAGPILDMGVYGLHLVTGLLGPAKKVTALSAQSRPERPVRRGPLKGMQLPVAIDDNVLILLEFSGSRLAFVDSGFCVPGSKAPQLELFCTDGSISMGGYMADPPYEIFMDDIARGVRGWVSPDERIAEPATRAVGVAHIVDVLLDGAKLVLTPEHARHVIEIMNQAQASAKQGRAFDLVTTF